MNEEESKEISNIPNISYNNIDDINISTQTIIAKTNWKINIQELFANLPVTEYKVIPKKRGRRPKNEKKVEPQVLNDGEIITLKLGPKLRGVDLKEKKKEEEDEKDKDKDKRKVAKKNEDNYFRNSITVVMFCEGKLINFKISKNGKFQFTGCKNDSHSHKCLDYVRKYIAELPNDGNKKILSLPINGFLEVYYITVMSNINFSLGFCINKENLDEYINSNTDYNSLLETTFGYTGVNIKMNIPKLSVDNIPLIKMIYKDNEWHRNIIKYADYLCTSDEKEKSKEKHKTRFITFLCFQSGNVILSAPHKECMRETYYEFIKLINKCKNYIEEKIEV